ncbi:MAG TPA: mechanosensitive ion channel family protein [Candidatus Acidoferrum sp.]|nr:mechanosensitive ion channel family protein [Candidatus Acidoferrum sp.]
MDTLNAIKPILDSVRVLESEHIVVGWMVPVIVIAGAFIIGLIFEKVVLGHLRKLAERTPWQGDEIIIHGLRGVTTMWFLLAGTFAAGYMIPIHPTILGLIHKVLTVLVILSGTVVVSRIVVGFVNLSGAKEGAGLPSASILSKVAKFSVYLIGVLIVLQSLGISITPMLTALGVGGLAVALALQDTLGNLFAGIHILASRKIRPGEYISLETGQEGMVTDISWRNTTIRTPNNNLIIVPNSRIGSSIVTNYFQPDKEMSMAVPINVTFQSDLDKVERVATEIARQVIKASPGAVTEFAPLVRFGTMTDNGVTANIILKVRDFDSQFLIRHELIKQLVRQFKTEGIEIAVPARVLRMKPDDLPPGAPR